MIGVRGLTWGRTSSGWRIEASSGATLCVRLAFVYALGFIAYAFVRSAITVQATVNQNTGMIPTLSATWASLFVASLLITLLLLPFVALMGALTGIAVRAGAFIAPHSFSVGALVSLALVVLLHLGLRSMLAFSFSDLVTETALFWLELPCVIFILAGGWTSRNMFVDMNHA